MLKMYYILYFERKPNKLQYYVDNGGQCKQAY